MSPSRRILTSGDTSCGVTIAPRLDINSLSGSPGQLKTRQNDSLLSLVLSLLVLVGNLAFLVGFKEEDLAETFIRVNLCRQRRGIADFQCHEAFPFRLERCNVHDNSAAGIRRFAEADRQNVSWDAEVFHRASQRE